MYGRFFTHECEFDYIIVGAGSAGCVLANRLSADPNTRVLLIEAGGDDSHWAVRIPVGYLALIKDQQRNWQLETAPQPQLDNRKLYWPRGRMLGGSSSLNGMVYIRGQREDYDGWRDLGNAGWSYDEVLPLFKAVEDNERGASPWHGAGGELAVSETRGDCGLPDIFLEACAQAGYPATADFNGAQQQGAGRYQQTIRNGERCSSATAFLHPVLDRPNLFIQIGAHATRLTFDGRRVTGVAYMMRGVMRQAHAAREVILSGGVVHSPQLLLLSGIGPRAELERHGIACRQHMPGVGENLQDHIDVIVSQSERSGQSLHFGPTAWHRHVGAWWTFWRKRRGPLVSALEAGLFAALTPGARRPDVQYHFVNGLILDHGRQLAYQPGISLHACVLRPSSRGHIRLQSADPLAAPIIQPNYFSARQDFELLKRSVREARRILAQAAFKDILGAEQQPGAQVQSDAELEAFLRARSESVYHPAGSCKMGQDDLAVVDAELKVHGVDGLRVADASIMPTLISGNTNAASIMIGEKCARMILAARQPQHIPEQAAAA